MLRESPDDVVAFANDCQSLAGALELEGASPLHLATQLAHRAISPDTGPFARAIGVRLLLDLVRSGRLAGDAAAPLIGGINGCVRAEAHDRARAPSASRPTYVSTVLSMIERHHAAPQITSSWVASRCGISREQLSRSLIKHTGRGFVWHLHKCRIARAQHLLTHSDLPIKAIAVTVGYVHQGDLTRHFREVLRLTPSEYRALG